MLTVSLKKINRSGKDYSDPINEITDLTGIRLITYYIEDFYEIGDIIKKEFIVDYDNSIDKGQILDPDRFGYLSIHYIISLADNRRNLPEWSKFSGLKRKFK